LHQGGTGRDIFNVRPLTTHAIYLDAGQPLVPVAELEGQDSWQRSVVGVVSLSNNNAHLEQSLRTVLEESERILGRDLIGHELEVL